MRHNLLVAVIDNCLRQRFAGITHHRWSTRCRKLKGLQANKELEIRIIFDLIHQSSSVSPYRGLMISAASTIHNGLAGAPNPLQNCYE